MLYPRDTCCDCPARIEVVLNYMVGWILVKFVREHNHPLLVTNLECTDRSPLSIKQTLFAKIES